MSNLWVKGKVIKKDLNSSHLLRASLALPCCYRCLNDKGFFCNHWLTSSTSWLSTYICAFSLSTFCIVSWIVWMSLSDGAYSCSYSWSVILAISLLIASSLSSVEFCLFWTSFNFCFRIAYILSFLVFWLVNLSWNFLILSSTFWILLVTVRLWVSVAMLKCLLSCVSLPSQASSSSSPWDYFWIV